MSLSVFNPSLRRLAPFHLVLCPALSKPITRLNFILTGPHFTG